MKKSICEYRYFGPDQGPTEEPRTCGMPCFGRYCSRHAEYYFTAVADALGNGGPSRSIPDNAIPDLPNGSRHALDVAKEAHETVSWLHGGEAKK